MAHALLRPSRPIASLLFLVATAIAQTPPAADKSADLRSKSQQQLNASRERYDELIAAMRRAESQMKPVLKAFGDQVLFLKHNLNAQAIASLQTTTAQIDSDVQALIKDMEASINEANEFISQMKT